jgi:hypothetical protein
VKGFWGYQALKEEEEVVVIDEPGRDNARKR